jgi:predicted alpha/beta-fold hydrolase
MNRAEAEGILSCARSNLEENPFVCHPMLRPGHFQTIVGSQQHRRFPWGWQDCSEELVELSDGAQVKIKLRVVDAQRPTLMAIHGMSGSNTSGYMLALSHKASRKGWNFILPSLYDLAEAAEKPRIFHAGSSDSVSEILEVCTRRHGLQGVLLAGISMGGNILLKLLGEWGSSGPAGVTAAAVISPLMDLMSSWSVLDKPSNLLYRWYYLRRLRRLSMRRPALMRPFVDFDRLRQVRTIRGFDELVTAPLAGFDDAFHYYREVSAIGTISEVNIPTLVVHSKDDPLLPWAPLVREEVTGNRSLLLHLTESGGHVAFIAKEQRRDIDRSWAENRVIDFLGLATGTGAS